MADPLTMAVIGGLFVSHIICAALGFEVGAILQMRRFERADDASFHALPLDQDRQRNHG